MVQLAIELFGLVLVTTFGGFAAGFLSGKVRYSFADPEGQQPEEATEDVPAPVATLYDVEPVAAPAVARRIPDPAPPSVSRRKRRISS